MSRSYDMLPASSAVFPGFYRRGTFSFRSEPEPTDNSHASKCPTHYWESEQGVSAGNMFTAPFETIESKTGGPRVCRKQ